MANSSKQTGKKLLQSHSERSDVQHRAVEESILKIVIASIAKRCAAISLHHSLFLVLPSGMAKPRHSIFTTTFTFLLLFFLIASPAHAKYGGGTGGPNDPYLIFDANQMNEIGLNEEDWDKHFLLCADIDLVSFTGTSFNIIGYYVDWDHKQPFTGVFDGNGHTISNLTYDSNNINHIGLFGYVNDENAQIKDLGLIDSNLDAGTGGGVGALVSYLGSGTITNCYVQGGSVSGDRYVGGLVASNWGTISNCYSEGSVSGTGLCVGGLVGDNDEWGTIKNCYSTGPVSGDMFVGGLVGWNWRGTISNCYSTGGVTGGSYVGGLVGYNADTLNNCYATGSVEGDEIVGGLVGGNSGSISNCYSTGDVSGINYVGGLVGGNSGSISNCYSTGDVSGINYVGGLVGKNNYGTISNCYSAGNVSGVSNVGGLVGMNKFGTITKCYSTASVSGIGSYVGGLVGYNYYGEVITTSFWDIETSGQTTSAGGTGLPTAEMQMQVTFTDAGWDFVGKTVNGIEDIWFIPQQDYPHLWWEGMQVPMKMTPRTLNCRSKGNWVKAHLILPEGFTVADVNSNRPAVLHSFGFESAPLYVFVNKNERVQIEAAFEREAVCSLTGDWPEALTVAGFLTDGNIFLGTSTVRMITPGLKDIAELALYWLNADCVHPDFCDGVDLNRDSMVNLLDYALLMNSQVEFVSE